MTDGSLDLNTVPRISSVLAIATQRLSQLVRNELERLFAEHGDLNLIDWRICLKLFDSGPSSQKSIVEFSKMQQAQVSRSMRSLEDRGYIDSERGEEDRRSRIFSLTPAGAEQVKHYRPMVETFCRVIDNSFSDEEIEMYLAMSERIAAASLEASRKAGKKRRKAA